MTSYEQLACGSTSSTACTPTDNGNGLAITNTSFILYGKYVTGCEFLMFKGGSPTGNLQASVWNSSGVIQDTSDSVDVSTLTTSTSGTFVSFTGLTHTCAVGDIIGVRQVDGFNDSSNYARALFSSTVCVSNTVKADVSYAGVVCLFNGSGGCNYGNDWDAIGKFTYSDPPSSGGTRLPPPPLVAYF